MSHRQPKSEEQGVTTRLVELIAIMSEEQRRSLLNTLEERFQRGQRKLERKPYFTPVCYTTRRGAYTDFVQNLSAGGVFIGSKGSAATVGEEMTLAFALPISRKHVMLDGEVAWANEKGMGVKFKMIPQGEKDRIQSYLDMME